MAGHKNKIPSRRTTVRMYKLVIHTQEKCVHYTKQSNNCWQFGKGKYCVKSVKVKKRTRRTNELIKELYNETNIPAVIKANRLGMHVEKMTDNRTPNHN